MRRRPPRSNHRQWLFLQVLLALLLVAMMIALWLPAVKRWGSELKYRLPITQNGREIQRALRVWAADHQGVYPAGATANAAFRHLFVDGVVEREEIFGAFGSPFQPDGYTGVGGQGLGVIGEPVLGRGENHWMLTAGQTDAAPGRLPLVFENGLTPSWPPLWNAAVDGQAVRGRTWGGGKVLVVMADGSAEVVRMEEVGSAASQPEGGASGKDVFQSALRSAQVLDVED